MKEVAKVTSGCRGGTTRLVTRKGSDSRTAECSLTTEKRPDSLVLVHSKSFMPDTYINLKSQYDKSEVGYYMDR